MEAASNIPEPNIARKSPFLRWQLGMLGAVGVIGGADVAVLTATFKALENDLGLAPWSLGILVMVQAVTMNIASPIWGWLCDEGLISRKLLMTIGAAGWGVSMLLVATSMGISQMLIGRALNGLFLGLLVPLSQSAVAALVEPEEYGTVFGILESSRQFGCVVAGSVTAAVSQEIILGHSGWRLVCSLVGLSSCMIAILVTVTPTDVRFHNLSNRKSMHLDAKEFRIGIRKIVTNLREHMRIKTFNVIVLQGVFGSIPWAVMSFELMWLQYEGFSNTMVAYIVLISGVFGAVGPTIGGAIGDFMEKKNRDHGRIWTAQLSVFCGIPLTIVFLMILPKRYGASTMVPYIFCKALFQMTASWCSSAVNRPMLCEVVDSSSVASIMAWDVSLESASAAFLGPPFVGFLAQYCFGYQVTNQAVDLMPEAVRQVNSAALTDAMVWMMIMPWVMCFCMYNFLHVYYPKDRKDNSQPGQQGTTSENARLLPQPAKAAA